MTEDFILNYIPQRMRALGYEKYHLRYRDLIIEANDSLSIAAYNEVFFIIGDPPGIVVASDYGLYDSIDPPVENIHQHRGEILVSNPGNEKRRIKFLQVIIVN